MTTPTVALEHLEHERWHEAMDALLAAWRAHRSSTLERAITSLSEVLAAGVPAIDPDDRGWVEAWQERAKHQRAAELGALLPLVTHPPKGGIPRRVGMILAYGPDPRIGALLLDIIEDPPTTASSNFSMWSQLFAALPEHVDARARPRLEARAASRGGTSQFWPKLEAWIAAALPKLPPAGRLPKGWAAEIKKVRAAIDALADGDPPELGEVAAPVHDWDEVEDLGGARAALEAGDHARALDLLVGFWSRTREPSVAALIDRLGHIVDETQIGPHAAKKKQFHAAWMAAAEHPPPHTVGSLLPTLSDGKRLEIEERLETLTNWLPDPRVAQALVVITRDYMIGARDRLWTAVYEGLVHHADPRVAEYVEQRHARFVRPSILDRHRSESRAIKSVFDSFAEALASGRDLRGRERVDAEAMEAALEAIVGAQGAASAGDAAIEAGLVREVIANWDDDAPLLVYSDWLQERQDPRGQLIALDLALARGEKVKGKRNKWFKTHESELFGPLAGLRSWGEKFERGLLVATRISVRKGGLGVDVDAREQVIGDLRWALLRELDVSDDDEIAELFARAPLWSLKRLARPSVEALLGFAEREEPVPLRELELHADHDLPRDQWSRLSTIVPALPELEEIELVIWGPDSGRVTPPTEFFATKLVANLKRLRCGDETTGGVTAIHQWIERMVTARCPVPLVRVVGPELSAELHQVEPQTFEIDLTLDLGWDDADARKVLEAVAGLPRSRVRLVRLQIERMHEAVGPRIEVALEGLTVER